MKSFFSKKQYQANLFRDISWNPYDWCKVFQGLHKTKIHIKNNISGYCPLVEQDEDDCKDASKHAVKKTRAVYLQIKARYTANPWFQNGCSIPEEGMFFNTNISGYCPLVD